MQRIKILLQPKILRMLALGLILLASLLLLIQDNYGSHHLVTMGTIAVNSEANSAIIDVAASHPLTSQREMTVSASKLLLKNIEKAGSKQEFLAVVNQRGEKLVFERIYVLTESEDSALQGPRSESGQLSVAVGSKPELVEMVGLDRFGYLLSQPVWAKEKLPGASMVYYQLGNMDGAKDILDGVNLEFIPDVFVLNAQDRIVGMRKISGHLLPLPELLRQAAIWLYAAAFLVGLGALLVYKWPALSSAGRRIWDQVSKRGRKASS